MIVPSNARVRGLSFKTGDRKWFLTQHGLSARHPDTGCSKC